MLLACLGYGAVIVLSAGTLMLALSSLSRNSRYIALFWVALWFVTSIVATILDGLGQGPYLMRRGPLWRAVRASSWRSPCRRWA